MWGFAFTRDPSPGNDKINGVSWSYKQVTPNGVWEEVSDDVDRNVRFAIVRTRRFAVGARNGTLKI